MKLRNALLAMALASSMACGVQNPPDNAISSTTSHTSSVQKQPPVHYNINPGEIVEIPRFSERRVMEPDYRKSLEFKVFSDTRPVMRAYNYEGQLSNEYNQEFGKMTDINGNGLVDVAMIIDKDHMARVYDAPKHPNHWLFVLEYDKANTKLKKVFEYKLSGIATNIELSRKVPRTITVRGQDYAKNFVPDRFSYRPLE